MQSSRDAQEDLSLSQLQDRIEADDLAAAGRSEIVEYLTSMVLHPEYPCLGARSVFNLDRATVVVLEELGTKAAAQALLRRLTAFARNTDLSEGFASCVAVFRGPQISDEQEFEALLWRQLELLHEADQQPWNPSVSDDPANPHFAFSVAGTAYFVVGLHPLASRIARRTPLPTLVFNLHEQFEELRESERFARMRDTIRRRDAELQGSVNPMVQDHGAGSEARQYSGRRVPAGWEPPAHLGSETSPSGIRS
jgi:hypothetical protein